MSKILNDWLKAKKDLLSKKNYSVQDWINEINKILSILKPLRKKFVLQHLGDVRIKFHSIETLAIVSTTLKEVKSIWYKNFLPLTPPNFHAVGLYKESITFEEKDTVKNLWLHDSKDIWSIITLERKPYRDNFNFEIIQTKIEDIVTSPEKGKELALELLTTIYIINIDVQRKSKLMNSVMKKLSNLK